MRWRGCLSAPPNPCGQAALAVRQLTLRSPPWRPNVARARRQNVGRDTAGRREVRLSFDDLERLRGAPLPRSARSGNEYWCGPQWAWVKAGWRASAGKRKVGSGMVIFEKLGEVAKGSRKVRPWARLLERLEAADAPKIVLNFEELEALRGSPLPASALRSSSFWSSPARSWSRAGYVANPGRGMLRSRQVEFTRL